LEVNPRTLTLTPEQDNQLMALELGKGIHLKARLRATIVRLVAQGWSVAHVATHYQRTVQSVHNDLNRYEEQGVIGLADKPPPGNKSKFTEEIILYIHELLKEDRTWNCTQIKESIFEKFAISISASRITAKLHDLGYSWKRCRYSPAETTDPQVVADHKGELEALKKKLWKVS
jgi:transposase